MDGGGVAHVSRHVVIVPATHLSFCSLGSSGESFLAFPHLRRRVAGFEPGAGFTAPVGFKATSCSGCERRATHEVRVYDMKIYKAHQLRSHNQCSKGLITPQLSRPPLSAHEISYIRSLGSCVPSPFKLTLLVWPWAVLSSLLRCQPPPYHPDDAATAPPRLALHPRGLRGKVPVRRDQGDLPQYLPLRRGARQRAERVLLRTERWAGRVVQGPSQGERR